jgi:GrpB-like predicted nucleotidyltransferase (UPF0157 family)
VRRCLATRRRLSNPRDAFHIAIAAVHGVQYLATWNFKHIANPRSPLGNLGRWPRERNPTGTLHPMKNELPETGLIGGVEKREIVIADYDPRWPDIFQAHATIVEKALGSAALRIEHIGSTSVPGLGAKPIVDMLLVVEDSADELSYRKQMEQAGYQLRVREPDFHEHRMFRTAERDVHVHVFSPSSPEIERYLTFRDRLRSDAGARRLYEQTKRQLAMQSWPDMNAYAEAKSEVIQRIIAAL